MNKFERFCYKHENWGVSHLMLFIAICNLFVYGVAAFFPSSDILSWLYFDSALVLKGQVWRLITFVFIPLRAEFIWLLIACYFYYWIGRTLENEWGKLKFNIFYLTGMVATIIYCWLSGAAGTAFYLNLSMFFAYATLYPEHRILLFFIIPIKIKYIAYLQAGIFALTILGSMSDFPRNLAPLVAMLNYLLYFYNDIYKLFRRGAKYSRKHVDFKAAVRQAQSRPGYEGHVHKCTACGITDTQAPDMEFRYCSLCAHYECYCSQHIFTHEHIGK